jgi:hypothetical protein
MPYVGSSVPSLLDPQLVAGRGQYTADVSLPEMGYVTDSLPKGGELAEGLRQREQCTRGLLS